MATIEKTYVIAHPLNRVFAAWVSEQTVIPPAARMEIEPRVGGAYRLIMPDDSKMQGEFLAFEDGARLVYTWQWVGDDEATTVEVNFAAEGEATRVMLTHGEFTSEAGFANHSEGWDNYVRAFEAHLQ